MKTADKDRYHMQGDFVPDMIHIHGFYFQEQGSLA